MPRTAAFLEGLARTFKPMGLRTVRGPLAWVSGTVVDVVVVVVAAVVVVEELAVVIVGGLPAPHAPRLKAKAAPATPARGVRQDGFRGARLTRARRMGPPAALPLQPA